MKPHVINGIDVNQHQGLVGMMVQRFRWAVSQGMEMEDLMQAGAIGLIKAAERYDASRGWKYSTYAVHWIRAELWGAVEFGNCCVRVPRNVRQKIMARQVELEGQTDPDLEADKLPVINSLDKPDALDRLPVDSVVDPSPNPEEQAMANEVSSMVERFPPRTRAVIRGRYSRGWTLNQLGEEIGTTRERARQILENSIDRLRQTS